MSREISTPAYRKKNVTVPNYYPSFKLEWAHFGEEKPHEIDIFYDWHLADQMLSVQQIVNGYKLTRNKQYLDEKIKEDYEGNYVDYLFCILIYKYRGKSEYEDHNNRDNNFYKIVEANSDQIKHEIDNFINHKRKVVKQ